jgi:hypothetical protein
MHARNPDETEAREGGAQLLFGTSHSVTDEATHE